jgi:hypothetical protein
MVDHYGEIPGLSVRNAATAYLTAGGRMSQDSEQLYQCLRKSLSKDGLSRVMNEKEKFQVPIGGDILTDGPLFLLTIVSLAYTNTRSMSSVHRNKLSQLTQKMQSIPDNNITVFNTHVNTLVKLLAAGGEKCEDLAWNLLRAYKATQDENFNKYMKSKEDQWKDGTINWSSTGNEIMVLAENYYKDAVENETWLLVTKEQEKIIALEAQIRAIKPYQARVRTDRNPKKDNRKQDSEGNKWPKWKDMAPTGTQSQVLKRDGKTFHWCPHHARWTVHKPSECNLGQTPNQGIVAEAPATIHPNRQTAMTTVTADSDTDSDGGYDTADSNN